MPLTLSKADQSDQSKSERTASSNIDVAQFHEYNCGITADEKEIIDISGEMPLWLTNFSIVNGGTTFTSIRDMKSADINHSEKEISWR